MAERKPKVPRTIDAALRLLERPDLTALELARAQAGIGLLLVEGLAELRAELRNASAVAGRALDVVLKQHATLLLDRTDPPA